LSAGQGKYQKITGKEGGIFRKTPSKRSRKLIQAVTAWIIKGEKGQTNVGKVGLTQGASKSTDYVVGTAKQWCREVA